MRHTKIIATVGPASDSDAMIDTARRLALYWGVVPVRTDMGENVDSAGRSSANSSFGEDSWRAAPLSCSSVSAPISAGPTPTI